jgi:IS30 family transposase
MAQKLNMDEREQIAQFLSQDLSRAEIARRLGRHRSTIGRDLRRNGDEGADGPSRAQQKTQARRSQRRHKLDDPALREAVCDGLVQHWSPEQIAGRRGGLVTLVERNSGFALMGQVK